MVSAFASWHEHHDVAVDALGNGPRLPGHCALEALSVLTRLPPPFRAPGPLVTEFLEVSFRDPPLVLAAEQFAALVQRLPGLASAAAPSTTRSSVPPPPRPAGSC